MKLTTPPSTHPAPLHIDLPQGRTLKRVIRSARVLSNAAPTGPARVLSNAARLEHSGTYRACSPTGPARVLSNAAPTGPARVLAPVCNPAGKLPRVRLLSKKVRRAAAASFGITFLTLFQFAYAIELTKVKTTAGELSTALGELVPIIGGVVIAGAVVAYMMGNSQAKTLALKAIVLSSIATGLVKLVSG